MKNLIPESQIPRTEHANEVWSREEDDAMLDRYLAGASPNTLAADFKRKPKAIVRRIDYYRDNERDWVVNYKPVERISRKGKRITTNEKLIIDGHRTKKIAPYLTARVLARDVSEIDNHSDQVVETKQLAQALAPKLDLIWAYRYCYFVYKQPVITDSAYNDLVEEEIEYGGGLKAFATIKHHKGWPSHIISLAMYLSEKKKLAAVDAGETYAVGETGTNGGMFYGPVTTLKEARAWDGKSANSRIYRLKGDTTRAIARWDVDKQTWIWREGESP